MDLLRRVIGEASDAVNKSQPSEVDTSVVSLAQVVWERDPFYRERLAHAPRNASQEEAPHFVYSGYLAVGETKVAVINGEEYEVGDRLALPGFVLRSIHPKWVVIAREGGGNAIKVTLEEEGL